MLTTKLTTKRRSSALSAYDADARVLREELPDHFEGARSVPEPVARDVEQDGPHREAIVRPCRAIRYGMIVASFA